MMHTLLLCLFLSAYTDALTPTPSISYRSQSENAARELVGLTQHINRAVDHFYSVWAITPAYTESFEANRIADCLFGCDLRSDTLSALDITGSGIEDRNVGKEWLADYFGLPRDFSSTVKFEPVISNIMVDFYWYFGLNNILRGLYATIHAPIVYTTWDLNYFEAINKRGEADQPPGYFNQVATGDNVGVRRTDLLRNFTDFVFHEKTPDLGDLVSFCPLEVAKMTPRLFDCNKTKTALSDIQAVLGWNFLLSRWYHLGAGLRGVAPTGTRPTGEFIFEPIVGNGKHWEAGAQVWGHYTWYVSENEEKQWMAYFLANITHLFNSRQCRVFDLHCKPNSRWMLAERMTPNVVNLQAALLENNVDPGNLSTPSAQFTNTFMPVANLTQRNVKVSAAIQCDLVAMFSYLSRNLNVDFGYNFWYRSCEKICKVPCKNSPLQTQLWALKGDSYTFGFTSTCNPAVAGNIPVALSATQSEATIHAGTNNFVGLNGDMGGIDGIRPTRNPGIDNRCFAAATVNGNSTELNDRTTKFKGKQTNTSNNPVFITEDQLDICSASTKGLSHKLFFNVSYSWFDYPCEQRIPYLGGGLDMEFGKSNAKQTKEKHLDGCQYCAISQWGMWLKGGISFN